MEEHEPDTWSSLMGNNAGNPLPNQSHHLNTSKNK